MREKGEMVVSLVFCEDTLMDEVADKQTTRDSLAQTYAMSLCSVECDEIDWPRVNKAIIDRWSLSALEYIKKKAWRLLKEKQPEKSQ